MNFKEALIAHLQGEKVEVRASQMDVPWKDFGSYHRCIRIQQIPDMENVTSIEYRLAPRTIKVNGVDVPAPERVAPKLQQYFFCPHLDTDEMWWTDYWANTNEDKLRLERGLVYLNKKDAIARAKAMLLTQE